MFILFERHFVKTGIVSKRLGKFCGELFDTHHECDYIEVATVTPAELAEVNEPATYFAEKISRLIEKEFDCEIPQSPFDRPRTTPAMQPHGLLESALYVSDIARADAFYANVLGLQRISMLPERHVFYYCGDNVLLLFRAEATRVQTSSVPAHGAHGPGHMAFLVKEEEMEGWRLHLQRRGVAIETEIRWPEGGYSIYFRDPDGNSLELATANVWPAR